MKTIDTQVPDHQLAFQQQRQCIADRNTLGGQKRAGATVQAQTGDAQIRKQISGQRPQFQPQTGLPFQGFHGQCLDSFLDRRYLQHNCSDDKQGDEAGQNIGQRL